MLLHIIQERRDGRIKLDYNRMDAPTYVEQRLLSFCGSHKDPFYKDERETRILAYPGNADGYRVFTGLVARKAIYRRSSELDSARYIVLGEHRRPGLQPERVLIGPEAEMEKAEIQALFSNDPVVIKPTFPVRRLLKD